MKLWSIIRKHMHAHGSSSELLNVIEPSTVPFQIRLDQLQRNIVSVCLGHSRGACPLVEKQGFVMEFEPSLDWQRSAPVRISIMSLSLDE